MSALHLSYIRELYSNGAYSASSYKEFNELSRLTKLPDNYVFNEELSVKRNRELVEEHNSKIEALKTKKRVKQSELDRKLTDDVVAYIKEYYDLNERQARLVENWVYREKHAFISDYFDNIDTFAEFAYGLLDIKDEE